jgi:hypothetical protein
LRVNIVARGISEAVPMIPETPLVRVMIQKPLTYRNDDITDVPDLGALAAGILDMMNKIRLDDELWGDFLPD